MKVLFNHNHPFMFVAGGAQAQIEQTRLALLQLGVGVEWLRWWDRDQKGDLIHLFGRPSAAFLTEAQ